MLNVADCMKGNQGNQEGNLTCMPIDGIERRERQGISRGQ